MSTVHKSQKNIELSASLSIAQWSQSKTCTEFSEWRFIPGYSKLSIIIMEKISLGHHKYTKLFDWKHNWLNLGIRVYKWMQKQLKRILSDVIKKIFPLENAFLFFFSSIENIFFSRFREPTFTHSISRKVYVRNKTKQRIFLLYFPCHKRGIHLTSLAVLIRNQNETKTPQNSSKLSIYK